MSNKISVRNLGEATRRKGKYQLYFDCIFCDDNHSHLGVHIGKGIFHCFKCGSSGRVSDIETRLDDFENRIKQFLGEPEVLNNKSEDLLLPPFSKKVMATSGLPYRYLQRRLITDSEIKEYHIHYCYAELFKERIIIPIYNQERLIYFVGRAYTNRQPKYLNAPVPKDNVIFKTFNEFQRYAVIVEGIFDALRIGKYHPAISILGKAATNSQLQSILESAGRFYIMLDDDATKDAFKLYEQIMVYSNCKIIMIRQHDPGGMSKEEINDYVK